MNLPTKLTVSRIVLTFLIMALLFVPGVLAKGLALGLFLLACATDWWDGLLARRLNQITPLGILLDPIADKILVLGLLITFVQLRLVPAWMVVVILIRELVITGVRLYAASRQVVMAASREGKHKAASQMLMLLIILVLLFVRELMAGAAAATFEAWMRGLIFWGMGLTVLLTVASGAAFFWRQRGVLRDAVGR